MRVKINTRVILGILTASILSGGFVFAAVNIFSSTQAESGTRSGNVAALSDTSASGASAVKFGTSAGSCPIASRLTITSGNQSSYPAYSLGTQVWVPDGPDPWQDGTDTLGGCFPGPTNTGVPAGTTLSDYVASLPAHNDDPGHLTDNFYFPNEETCYIKAANTVIQNQEVNCSLRIRSKNVQIITHNNAIGCCANPAWDGTPGGGSGGAIYSDGTSYDVNIYGSLIEHNTAKAGGSSLFYVSNDNTGHLSITDSISRNNTYAANGLDGNPHFENYPGIFYLGDGPPTFTNSTVQ